jgi:hypothetical protein
MEATHSSEQCWHEPGITLMMQGLEKAVNIVSAVTIIGEKWVTRIVIVRLGIVDCFVGKGWYRTRLL